MGIKCIIKNVKKHTGFIQIVEGFQSVKKPLYKAQTKGFLPLVLTHLRSQDLFEVILILHICGLLFPGMAIVTQWHLLVVAIRNNTSEEKEDKEGMLISTKSLTASIPHLQQIQVLH